MRIDDVLVSNPGKFIVFTRDAKERTFKVLGTHSIAEEVRKMTRGMPNDDSCPLYVSKDGKFYEPHKVYEDAPKEMTVTDS